jgi:hypothetical protein
MAGDNHADRERIPAQFDLAKGRINTMRMLKLEARKVA